jgi:DNA topoisomerase-3
MKVILAEKPSVARDIARFLGCRSKKNGWLEGNGYQVTWAYGHLVGLKEPDEYDPTFKRWSLAPLPIIPDQFQLKPTGDGHAKKQLKTVMSLFRKADALICATDAGREGELIFRYIVEMSGCIRKPVERLWLSSLTDTALRNGFAKLRPGSEFDNLYAAARCRSEADWIVGMNATRSYTVRYGGRQTLWSVGRVQTPLLAMIVTRDDEIRRFIPEPFWELYTGYREVRFKYVGKRFSKAEAAQTKLTAVDGKPFTISKVEEKKETRNSPLLYDLTDLQRDMNRRYGMSAADTLKVAQRLYERKLITYPRTDSRFLTSDMKPQIPRLLGKLSAYMPEVIGRLDLGRLLFSGRIINNKRVTDHHAIIPTGASPTSLSGRDKSVYDAILTRLLAVLYPPCIRNVTKVTGESNGVAFQARGVRVLDPGWTVLYPRKKKQDDDDGDQELPAFVEGESGPHAPFVKEGVTKPPRAYTENTLLAAMETAGKDIDDEELREAMKERGLGTPATRASMIETLLNRNYIERRGKAVAATELGRYLIAIVSSPNLTSPELTGEWEAQLKQIEQGRATADGFMAEIAEFANEAVRRPADNSIGPDELGKCPCCGAGVIKGKRGYGCSDWQNGCRFVLWGVHEGYRFNEAEVRQLLHNRVLSSGAVMPGYPEPVGVAMNGHGEIILLPRSVAGNRAKKNGGGRGRSRPARGGGGNAVKDAEAVGVCPTCGEPVTESAKAFGCSAWKSGCKFVIWKKIAGKAITRNMAATLISNGQTNVLKGFKSKAGKSFSARLKLEDGQVKMDFDK